MESGFVAVGAAAVAYYVYKQTRRDSPVSTVETHRHVEQAPRNWTGELYLFAEALRYLYLEYITHWQTADLFIGLFYLARQGIRDYPAAEVVANGNRVHPKALERPTVIELKNKFEIMYRLLIYSQKLRNTSVEIPVEEWVDLELSATDFVVYRPKASVLCPAYIIVRDPILHCFVLAIRGTHTTRDIFTSLSGAAKPHHYVDQHGLVLGYSHFGMLAGARWIFKHCKNVLLAAHEAQPDYKLLVTGHSMGGGAAAILTMMLREQLSQFSDAECYTFACPGCMTLELAESCAPYVTTLIYGTDVVPTISPGAGDLLREEVERSSWVTSFKQDIRSSPLVQTIESRVKGMYRSASSWTLRQAKTVSNLTTSCVRPRDQHISLSMSNLQEAQLSATLTKDISKDTDQENNADDNGEREETVGCSQQRPALCSRTDVNTRGTLVSDMWSKISSFSWKRRISDADVPSNSDCPSCLNDRCRAIETGHHSVDDAEEIVEGVFNAQGIEDDRECEDREASTSSCSQSNPKRLLYPAGKIYHLVPEYILKADPSPEEHRAVTSEASSSSELESWYHPSGQNDVGHEESAFVLFSEMPQQAYGKIRVCRSMVMDHFVPRYKTALRSTIHELHLALEGTTIHDI